MKLTIKLFAALLGGLACHQLYRPSISLGDRWGSLFRYAVGWLATLPFLLMLYHDAKNEDEMERLTATYLLAGGAFGSGSFIGHLLDRLKGGLE